VEEFITQEEHDKLMEAIDTDPYWVESQSGRRKIDYGPKANFKKKKVKPGDRDGLPLYAKTFVLDNFSSFPQLESITKTFEPIEVNILEYHESKGSNIAPHMDDFWLWGERIAGLSLCADSVMTFSKNNIEIEVPIPARSLYIISGSSRNDWMHGIKSKHISGRRLVCTIRELTPEFKEPSN